MNYIIAEIRKDHTLWVIDENVPEEEIVKKVCTRDHCYRNLMAIPCKKIEVANYNDESDYEITIE